MRISSQKQKIMSCICISILLTPINRFVPHQDSAVGFSFKGKDVIKCDNGHPQLQSKRSADALIVAMPDVKGALMTPCLIFARLDPQVSSSRETERAVRTWDWEEREGRRDAEFPRGDEDPDQRLDMRHRQPEEGETGPRVADGPAQRGEGGEARESGGGAETARQLYSQTTTKTKSGIQEICFAY